TEWRRGYTHRRSRAGGGIGRRARLRALWGDSPVEVRVLFGASREALLRRGFLRSGGGSCPVADSSADRTTERPRRAQAQSPGRASASRDPEDTSDDRSDQSRQPNRSPIPSLTARLLTGWYGCSSRVVLIA